MSGGDNFTLRIWLGLEANQTKWNMRLNGVRSTDGTPACSDNFSSGDVQLVRSRSVACPAGFDYNVSTAPAYSYCWRNPAASLRQRKDFGPNEDCDLQVANPVNAATGNKHTKEVDYRGTGEFPLEYARSYNSAAALYGGTSPSGPGFVGRSPMWRGTYDRAVMFNEHPLYPAVDLYRHTGQVVRYKSVGGVWHGDASANDRLIQHVDSNGATTGWTLITTLDERESYDANGRLLSIQSRAGITHLMEYDVRGRLTAVRHDFGHLLRFTYDTYDRLATMIDPGGGVYVYQYLSTSRRLVGVAYPDARSRTYRYENSSLPDALTGINDESQVAFASYSYHSDGRVAVSAHAQGVNRYSFTYPSANITTVTDPLNTVRTYSHGRFGGGLRLTGLSEPCATCGSASKSKSFDAAGNPSSTTDFRNNVTTYTYDQARNLQLSRTEASGTPRARSVSTTWHPQLRLPAVIEESGRTTSFTHDARGNILTRTVLDTSTNQSRAWTYSYNSFGQVLTVNGPRTDVSDVTTYTYHSCSTGYECGHVHTITNAGGHVTTYSTYNAHGQPLVISDPNGVVTTLAYDLRQRLISRAVGTEVTSLEYWPTGLPKKTTLPDGSYLEYTYDAAHRLSDISDAEGNRIHYTLDLMGNRTGEQAYDPSNALTRTRFRVFDALNRLQKEIGAANTANVTTTFGYDNNGNQTSIAAPLGRDSSQGYDELNRLTSATDPLNGGTQYGYSVLDQLISVTDPRGLVTEYSYNALGDLEQQTSPDTGVTTNTYDSGGNLATSTDARGAVSTYTYDALNRVATASFATGSNTDPTLTYTYDTGTHGNGRLTGVADSNHALSWTYDAQGRVLTAGQAVGSVSKTTSYSYANGLRQSMTTPSGQVITYGYTNGKVTSVSVNGTLLVSGILYEPFGPVRQWTWANGALAVRTFDQDGKVTQIDSEVLKTYSYDDAFRITGITDASNAALSWTYGYDDLDRLTSASTPGTTLGYTYDANGNRLTQTGTTASTFAIATNSNRLSSTSGALTRTYGYDNAGNTTSFTGLTFTYNNRGRMSSSTKSGVTTSYVYNALGQLIQKGTNTLYYYDEAGHVLGTYSGSGALVEEIVWLGDIPIISLRPKATGGINIYNIHTDHLNTPRLITGSVNPGIRWRWDAEPFGGGTVNNNPSGVGVFDFHLRFPGQIYVVETGLNYNYFRDYDPATGRYVESDPIGLQGGLNTYAYANNSPLMFVDETGENAAAGGAAIGGALLARVCSRAPAVCKELAKCIINPSTCRQRFCRMQPNRIYHPFCDIPGCAPGDSTATAQFKLASAEACLLLRQFVTAVCHAGKSDAGHDREERVAKDKIKSCQGMCLTN
ncbi:RHS repeat-associated core domain-containing protein [Steroidobacter cummioxidans]|uniref:RHS repeat-associated core domain-containing protein n=1 Tax=Steroidobacter cummioxidans TaxID=1803913 RepID=UPI00137A3D5A|nr:RHS repeat-associated core domain-containing protein [Steroidobacter cummioxidans]